MPERPEPHGRRTGPGGPTKAAKRHSFWGRLGVLALIPLVLYTIYAVAEKSVQTYRLRNEAATVRAEIEAEKRENLQLQQDLVAARSEQQVEDAARRDLGLVRPGDNAVVLVSNVPAPTPTVRPTVRPEPIDEPPGWLAWLLDRLGL
jgi:cell division protein FtsL